MQPTRQHLLHRPISALLYAMAALAISVPVGAEVQVELLSGYAFAPGDAANGDSSSAYLSPDGRYLAMSSRANNLVASFSDQNGAHDALVLDRLTGEYDYASHSLGQPGVAAEGASRAVAVSDDGRWVLYASQAPGLITGIVLSGNPSDEQLYLFDRTQRATRLVSHVPGQPLSASNDAATGIRLSGDGRFALFETRGSNMASGGGADNRVFLYDRQDEEVRLISHAAGSPGTASAGSAEAVDLSADGSLVLFTSSGSDHVAGVTDIAGSFDVFLYDRAAAAAQLISHRAGAPRIAAGAEARDLTPDGRFVLLDSPNVGMISGLTDGNSALQKDVFVYDRQSGLATLATPAVNNPGASANTGSIGLRLSDDGNTVYLLSPSDNLVLPFGDLNGFGVRDLFRFDKPSGLVSLVSHEAGQAVSGANGPVAAADSPQAISPDGRFFLYVTTGTNLQAGVSDTNGEPDIYLFDRNTAESALVSRRGGNRIAGSGVPSSAVLGPDGDVLFTSDGPLDPGAGDPLHQLDVFAFDRSAATVRLESRTGQGGIATLPGGTQGGSLTPNGRYASWLAYLRDNLTGIHETMGHTIGIPGLPANAPAGITQVSRDGRFVGLVSRATDLAPGVIDTNNLNDLFVYDRDTDAAFLVSHAFGDPGHAANGGDSVSIAAMTPDARQFFYNSRATNLVEGQNGASSESNLFFYDRPSAAATLVSHGHDSVAAVGAPGGSSLRAVSTDQRFVVFASGAHNLIPGFVDHNDYTLDGLTGEPEGTFVYVRDLYFYDRATRQATLISHLPGLPNEGAIEEEPTSAYLTADGSAVYYTSERHTAAGHSDPRTFRWDRASNTSQLLTQLAGGPIAPCGGHAILEDMSADGGLALITTRCAFALGDTNESDDAYLYDRQTSQFRLVSHHPAASHVAAGGSGDDLSADGRRLIFRSAAGVPHSYDRITAKTIRLTSAHDDPRQPVAATVSDASDDGYRVLVVTDQPFLVPLDANAANDLFLVTLDGLFTDGFESGATGKWSQTVP